LAVSSAPIGPLFRTWGPLGGPLAGVDGDDHAVAPLATVPAGQRRLDLTVGVISNGRAHRNQAPRNQGGARPARDLPLHVLHASPSTPGELDRALADFARAEVGALVIDGGDGTIRDVLSAAPRHFGETLPMLALVPSGKTNALAIDLGVPRSWTVEDAIAAVAGCGVVQRAPLEIARTGEPGVLRGFLLGAGGFVGATALAQRTHRAGAFRGLAVGLSLAGAVAQTLFGGRGNRWRRGEPMRVELADGRRIEQPFYLLLASTLERLPLGLKPFGRVRAGLKLLGVDAPPWHLGLTVPALLAGSEAAWIASHGYHRADTARFRLRLDGEFVLDGETYAGGDLSIRRGVPLAFLSPAAPRG